MEGSERAGPLDTMISSTKPSIAAACLGLLASLLPTPAAAQAPLDALVEQTRRIREWTEAIERTRLPAETCGSEIDELAAGDALSTWHPSYATAFPGSGRPAWVVAFLELERAAQVTSDKCLKYSQPGAASVLQTALGFLQAVPPANRKRSGALAITRLTSLVQEVGGCSDGARRDKGACGLLANDANDTNGSNDGPGGAQPVPQD